MAIAENSLQIAGPLSGDVNVSFVYPSSACGCRYRIHPAS
jgi:hypothetical protein